MFQTKVVEKLKAHNLCSVTFSRKSFRLGDNVENVCRPGQGTDGNMAYAHCMLDANHTLRNCNTCYFSTATIAVGTLFSVTLYIHCLS